MKMRTTMALFLLLALAACADGFTKVGNPPPFPTPEPAPGVGGGGTTNDLDGIKAYFRENSDWGGILAATGESLTVHIEVDSGEATMEFAGEAGVSASLSITSECQIESGPLVDGMKVKSRCTDGGFALDVVDEEGGVIGILHLLDLSRSITADKDTDDDFIDGANEKLKGTYACIDSDAGLSKIGIVGQYLIAGKVTVISDGHKTTFADVCIDGGEALLEAVCGASGYEFVEVGCTCHSGRCTDGADGAMSDPPSIPKNPGPDTNIF